MHTKTKGPLKMHLKSLFLEHTNRARRLWHYATAKEISSTLSISIPSAYKLINKQHKLSAAHLELLQIKLLGVVPMKEWDHFRFTPDHKIITPNGYSFSANELDQLGLLKQIYYKTQIELQRKEAKIAELEQRILELERPAIASNVVAFPSAE